MDTVAIFGSKGKYAIFFILHKKWDAQWQIFVHTLLKDKMYDKKWEDDQHTLNPGKGDNAIIHKGNSYLLSIISNEMTHTQNK